MKQIPYKQLSSLAYAVHLTLKSGIPIIESIEIMIADENNKKQNEIYVDIYEKLREGQTFSEAIKENKRFPKYFSNMVNLAFKTGTAERTMLEISEYYDKKDMLRNLIRGAISGPLVLVGLFMMAFIVLGLVVVPLFSQIFEGMGLTLTGGAYIFMDFIKFTKSNVLLLIIIMSIIIILVILTVRYISKGSGEKIKDRIGILKKIDCLKWIQALELGVKSGIDIEETLSLSIGVIDNTYIKDECKLLLDNVQKGKSFKEELGERNILNPMMAKLVQLGMEAGELDDALKKVSERYEEEIESSIARLLGIIEPIIVGSMCVLISIIMLSIIWPLITMLGSMM